MAIIIRAHYDGKVIVPDEPVDLPIDQPLQFELIPEVSTVSEEVIAERLRRLERVSGRLTDPSTPMDALRREHFYAEEA